MDPNYILRKRHYSLRWPRTCELLARNRYGKQYLSDFQYASSTFHGDDQRGMDVPHLFRLLQCQPF